MSYTVLIVDDNVLIRHALHSSIEQTRDWQVCGEAENGKVAVEKVKQLHPDVVILDLQMPFMNGLEVAGQINSLAPPHRNADVYDAQLRATPEVRSGCRYQ